VRTRRKTGSYEVGRAKRAEILDAATRLFAASGYHRVPLSQVAADVGLSESGLLHHFRSKRHLLLAVAERRLEQTALFWSSVQADGSDDPHELFRSMVESTRRLVAEPGLIELFVLVSAEAADPSTPAHQLYGKWYEQAVNETAQLLAAGWSVASFGRIPMPRPSRVRLLPSATGCSCNGYSPEAGWIWSRGIRDYARRLARSVLVNGDDPNQAV
jgi:AcrR family transcriptional regulator